MHPRAPDRLSRRALLAAGLSLTACKGRAQNQPPPQRGPGPALKSLAPFPLGCAVSSSSLAQPAFAALVTRHFSQLTAEWEMKMEYILKEDGTYRFDRPDLIAGFAREHGMRLFAHNLIWYAQDPVAFKRLDGQGAAFANAYANYIRQVAGRYRGQAVGWDVVNEPVAEDGNGYRPSIWSRNLGPLDYIRRAYDAAQEADPGAVLFINDYNLESNPRKRATFMRLVEQLLKAGTPIGGLGTQTHLGADLAPGSITTAVRELASFGLPIHVSELDISVNHPRGPFTDRADLLARQARLYAEAVDALSALPARQRFALTVWGLRDDLSWLRSDKENPRPPWDAPLLFDDAGEPKDTFWAVADALKDGRA